MLEVGETTGRLDTVLASLSDYYAGIEEISTSVKSAVTYPAILQNLLAGLAGSAFWLLLLKVIFPEEAMSFKVVSVCWELPGSPKMAAP